MDSVIPRMRNPEIGVILLYSRNRRYDIARIFKELQTKQRKNCAWA